MQAALLVMTVIMEIFDLCTNRIFTERALTSKKRKFAYEVVAWGSYFVICNCATYISGNTGINLVIFFLCSYILLTYLYQDSAKHIIYAIVLLYIIGMCAELIVYCTFYFTGIYKKNLITEQEFFLIGSSASKLVGFCLLKFFLLFMKKRTVDISLLDWLEAVFVPIGSIIILFVFLPVDRLFPLSDVFKNASVVLGITILLTINIASYYLYEKGKEATEKRMREKNLQEQCNYYMRQCEESKALWMELSKFRHDMKQRYIYVQALLEEGNYDGLRSYYEDNMEFLAARKSVAASGNIYFDSILNYKAEIVDRDGIQFDLELEIPHDCQTNGEEISICLGNLLDNAIEAAKEVEKDRRIVFVKIKVQRHNLYLEIRNPFQKPRLKIGNEYVSTKQDIHSHGWGLQIIRDIVDRYHGELEITDADSEFCVKALLYQIIK